MREFHVFPSAQQELEETIFHYSGLDVEDELADSFEVTYQGHLSAILTNPKLYNIREGMTRRANLRPRFGEYYIAYMIWNEKVIVLAIAHAKRAPYYWRNRISAAKEMFE